MILTQERLQEIVPSAYQTESKGMSSKYLQIPTARIIEAMQDSGFYPVKANQARKVNPEQRAFARHVIRFRAGSTVQDLAVNDTVPEIVLLNSHDGSSAYKMMLGLFRVVCANGLIVADSTLGSISVRHIGQQATLDRLIQGARDLSAQGTKVIDVVNTWKQKALDYAQKYEYVKGAFDLYKGDADLKLNNPGYLVHATRTADLSPDLWTVFNVVQEKLTRGGFLTVNANGQYRRARALKSIDRDLKLNRALWEYTAKFNQN